LQAPGWLGVGEKLDVKWGTDQTEAAMTGGTIYQNTNILYPSFTLCQGSFVPAVSGVYYIGWHAYSVADLDYIAIDDISIHNTPFTWTGNSGTDWNNPGNWNLGSVPGMEDKVIIPNTTNLPIIGNGTDPLTVSVFEVVLETGAVITVTHNATLNVMNTNP
jgi:hypothetical protein